jgi:hypothetical protein
MTLRFNNTISNLMRRLVGRNNETSVRYTRRSLLTMAHQSCRRSATRLAFACAFAIVPRIVLAQALLQELSPTVIIDTTSSLTGHAFFVERNGIYEDFFSAQGWFNRKRCDDRTFRRGPSGGLMPAHEQSIRPQA